MVGNSWQACPWMLDHGDSLRGECPFRGSPCLCWAFPWSCSHAGVTGTNSKQGRKNQSIHLSVSLEKFLKTLKTFLPGHAMCTPRSLGSHSALPISESVLWLCSGTLCYFSCKCSFVVLQYGGTISILTASDPGGLYIWEDTNLRSECFILVLCSKREFYFPLNICEILLGHFRDLHVWDLKRQFLLCQ